MTCQPKKIKKTRCCNETKGGARKEEKVNVVSSLRHKYPLKILLKIAGLSRSIYYFHKSKIDNDFKNDDIMNLIIKIYYDNKRRYGYRRVTLELRNRGFIVNHKKVLRLMNKMGLHSIIQKNVIFQPIEEPREQLHPTILREILRLLTPKKNGLPMSQNLI